MDTKTDEMAAPKGGKTDSLTIASDEAAVELSEEELHKVTGGTGSGTGKINKASI